MAVAKQSARAARMPNHMLMPAKGAPVSDCGANVSHRKAPGAISAMAFIVRPVRPRVGFILGASDDKLHLFLVGGRGEQVPSVRDHVFDPRWAEPRAHTEPAPRRS